MTDQGLSQRPLHPQGSQRTVEFSTSWDVLGPFQVGTREAVWGSDPLEHYGGFRTLKVNASETFRSSLAPDGLVSWTQAHASRTQNEHITSLDAIDLSLGFPDVDWPMIRGVYGWAALQSQAWARGSINVSSKSAQTVALYPGLVLEFWLDDRNYFGGDFYGFHKAPIILHLEPGVHELNIRIVGDVRSMGASNLPTLSINLDLIAADSPALADLSHAVLPDLVDGKFASELGSVPITNAGLDNIEVLKVRSKTPEFSASLLRNNVNLVSGQTRPCPFSIHTDGRPGTTLELEIDLRDAHGILTTLKLDPIKLKSTSIEEPHIITYLHPSGIVSYSLLRPPPSAAASASSEKAIPILVFLHGADVDIDKMVRKTFDQVSDLPVWGIYPSGVTTWCGDDWHHWGWSDVGASIDAISTWITEHEWSGPLPDEKHLIVTGHSNGGQGVWYALTHHPQNIQAAVAVSGYTSIQKYVPYTFWRESEPALQGLMESALLNYRHELLLPNLVEIPVMRQHGSIDDNVPTFHSRRIGELIQQAGGDSPYSELKGSNHYFEGIMTTSSLRDFYWDSVTKSGTSKGKPSQFSLVSANPSETGPRNGLHIRQLLQPDRLGRLLVSLTANRTSIKAVNVRRFALDTSYLDAVHLEVDQESLSLQQHSGSELTLSMNDRGSWSIDESQTATPEYERQGKQLGGLQSLLQSRRQFAIATSDEPSRFHGLAISRNLLQYYSADTEFINGADSIAYHYGNRITVSVAPGLSFPDFAHFPITIRESIVTIRDSTGRIHRYDGHRKEIGAIFLRPLSDERVNLIVWGVDEQSLAIASRLAPTLTGVGQPDFVIVTRDCLLQGLNGVHAMGYFDSLWNVTSSSYFA